MMGESTKDSHNFEVSENIFSNIKFFVSGEIPEQVVSLLKNGGAERLNYFSDYVTHLICGENPEENDISDATDLYEIPAVIPSWIYMCIKLKKLVNTKPYFYNPHKIFSNLVFCLSQVGSDRDALWSILTFHGGSVQLNLDCTCTHLVTTYTKSAKYEKALDLGPERISIVTPDWVIDSLRSNLLAQTSLYHPKLIQWPKVVKHESTTSITGFEPEKTEVFEKQSDNLITDSTQALLDKLKQRMPWNQPQAPVQSLITSSTDTIVPPNVVAPSFLNKTQQNLQTYNQTSVSQAVSSISNVSLPSPQNVISNQQIPRSVVHHTPQPQIIQQQQTLQHQPPRSPQKQMPSQQPQQSNFASTQLQLNRLIGQPQTRPALQQLRGQLAPNQLHQQLMQQRLAQQQQQQQQQQQTQQNNQRPFNLPQQQLLQQQLVQGQLNQNRQLLANQGQQQQLTQQMMGQAPQQPLGQPQLAQVQTRLANPNLLQSQIQQQINSQQQSQGQQQIVSQTQVQQQTNQNQQLNQVQQQGILTQGQPFGNMVQQQHILQQQQSQVLSQQNKLFLNQQQQQQNNQQNIVQTQPNLTIQQQFMAQQQQQQQQPQFVQQQPQNQHFVQAQQDLNQQQNLMAQQVQYQANNSVVNQQLQLGQQNQFNQQQPQGNQQPRPQINQQIWQQQQQQQQQQLQQQQMTVRHPVNIVQQGPRIQWSPNQQQPNQLPQRQFIQLDAQTHNQLQKMNPEQQALFVQRLQKQKQILMQKHIQQRAGGGHIFIRGSVPPGLNPQQQMQWLQRQAKQQGVVLPPNIQQQAVVPGQLAQPPLPPTNIQQHAPGLSPIQQQAPPFADPNQQQQLRQYRLQQLQLQREQAQKNNLPVAPQPPPPSPSLQQVPPRPLGPIGPVGPVVPDSTTSPAEGNVQQLVVNSKTKTALANMLSIRLQSGGGNMGGVSETIPEPSAAGTLRLMTAQHNAALNPNNRPQDLIALQQRRVINGPNGEVIRAPVPQAVPVTPPSEPPKLPFSPRATVPMQHRPGPFYGHNPNLKLPPDLFLLGCIFVVVEIERYLDESLPGWQQKIEKHGGEIEKQYCNRVTHVLCETQRHGVVMQALRDCKRCITIYWLSDVIKRKQVLPPWTALHLPTIYLDTTPVVKHLISLSGFTGSDRLRVKRMINYTGAKFTSYFSKHNTLLIAAKGDGPKYIHAKKFGIPVVNVQWLTDIMLGNFTALNQMEHIMYQQFPTPPNFSFDPKLVPNLMHGWKMPINISQDSYERVKRSTSPVLLPKKLKKLKTEHTDENDNVNENDDPHCNYKILFSMCSEVTVLQKIVKQLGGALAKNHQDCTHLVMPHLARTNKLLFCICRDVYLMPEQWLKDSATAQKFLDETNYSLDTKDFNSEYKCDFAQTLSTKNRNKLFEGKSFWITPSVFPSKSVIVELIQSCGGVVEKIRRTAVQIEATNVNSPYSYIIITHENDIHLVADLLKNKKDKIRIVCSAELIFSAILKQTFEVEPFAVKVL